MPLPVKPPNRVDPLNFPVFGMSWFGNPGDGLSLVAYCGGGGSAKTGVNNAILIRAPDGETMKIETREAVGVALKIVQNPTSGNVWLIVALGKTVERYHLPTGNKAGSIEVGGDGVNAIAINAMTDRLACGCENGEVKVYEIEDNVFNSDSLVYTCEGHNKTVCSIDFSMRDNRLVSSAKDGTARVWQEGKLIQELVCDVEGGNQSGKGKVNPKRPVQVLVRGCAFGDLEGKVVYTVASARRGSAFLSRWIESPEGFRCERTECSDVPISAMSLSGDAGLLALGSVSGSIILWGTELWKPLKIYKEVHDLPVTCIAARPYPVPLQGEEDGVEFHAISASADSRLAHLTLQKRAPKQQKPGDESFSTWIWNRMIRVIILLIALRPLFIDFQEKCGWELEQGNYIRGLPECILHQVLVAPSTHPGVMVPPY